METHELPIAEEVLEESLWAEPHPPRFQDEPLDLLAFELWREASCTDISTSDDDESRA